jgi:hypothetical protein
MKKLITNLLLVAGLLSVMPVWSGDRYDHKQYSKHADKYVVSHQYKKHWKKGRSHHRPSYGRWHRGKNRHYGHHDYAASYSHRHSPRYRDDDGHWGVVFRYFD